MHKERRLTVGFQRSPSARDVCFNRLPNMKFVNFVCPVCCDYIVHFVNFNNFVHLVNFVNCIHLVNFVNFGHFCVLSARFSVHNTNDAHTYARTHTYILHTTNTRDKQLQLQVFRPSEEQHDTCWLLNRIPSILETDSRKRRTLTKHSIRIP